MIDRRVFAVAAALFLFHFLTVSPVFGEQKLIAALPAIPIDDPPAYRRAEPTFTLPLPGEKRAARLELFAEKEQSVLIIAQGQERIFSGRVYEFSAEDGLRGSLVGNNGRFWGFLRRAGDKPAFFAVRPEGPEGTATAESAPQLHEVSRVEPNELQIALSEEDALFQPLPSISPREAYDTSGWREADLVIDASGDFTNGRGEDDVAAQVIATVNSVNLHLQSLRLQLHLRGVRIFQHYAGNDPYLEAEQKQDARAMLDQVRAGWRGVPLPAHDIAGVLAASRFSSIFGLAYPSTACSVPDYAVFFATQGGGTASAMLGLSATIAHEVGHIIGMTHDLNSPSLMSPYYIANPGGFSVYSVEEYFANLSTGGGACFSEIPAPPEANETEPGPLVFQGGSERSAELSEGQRYETSFQVLNGNGPVYYTAESLPQGAALDADTGAFIYTPSFDTANTLLPLNVLKVKIHAISGAAAASASLELRVANVNRPPLIYLNCPEHRRIEAGDVLQIEAVARDLDQGDAARLVLLQEKSFQKLRGRKSLISSGSGILLTWAVPETFAGIVPLRFFAGDSAGLASEKQVFIEATKKNLPVTLTAPGVVRLENGLAAFTASAEDPEGAPVVWDFQGAPAGMIVEYAQKNLVFNYAARSTAEERFKLLLSATDGNKTVAKEIEVLVPQGTANTKAVLWPGNPAENSEQEAGPVLYDYETGVWRELSCAGQTAREEQFGGFIGDLPLMFKRKGVTIPAIYRVIAGQGWWYARDAAQPLAWGLAEDLPVSGDFDGDMTSDCTVYRPSSNTWFINFSTAGAHSFTGAETIKDISRLHLPFSADVDGDGRADRVQFTRKADGTAAFHTLLSSGRQLAFVAARAEPLDVLEPFVRDMDSDGRADLGVVSSAGLISLFQSRSGSVQVIEMKNVQGKLLAASSCGATSKLALLEPGKGIMQLFSAVSSAHQAEVGIESVVLESEATLMEAQLRRSQHTASRAAYAVWRAEPGGFGSWLIDKEQGFERMPFPAPFSAVPVSLAAGSYADFAAFDAGVWWIKEDYGMRAVNWGQKGDIPVPADYNGDGRTDLAVYRPADASWWLLYNRDPFQAQASAQVWGEPEDVPVPEDYDGDGAADIAVWRPSTGAWYILYRDGRVQVEQFGQRGDVPLPGDYSGSGKAELALWRPGQTLWSIKRTREETAISKSWGLTNDIPVKGDFNNDGRVDLAVFRPENGTWYVQSLDSLAPWVSARQFGLSGDVPHGITPR